MELLVFVGATVIACWLLTRARLTPAKGRWNPGPRLLLSLPAQGLMVGLLTGIAGVGGGIAIVPGLVLIAVNALVAIAALGHWPASSLPLLLPLVLGGAIGALVGQRLAPHLSDRKLRKGFSALLLGSALFTGAEAVKRHPFLPDPTTGASSHSSHGCATESLLVEFLAESGDWEPQTPSLTTPGFRLSLLSLLLCQHHYLVANAQERGIPLKQVEATFTVITSADWIPAPPAKSGPVLMPRASLPSESG